MQLQHLCQTFQQPQQPAPETQVRASQVIQTTQMATQGQQQQPRGQLTSFLVVDDQQAGPSRPLTCTLTPMKQFNPPSVASATGEESQYNISGLSGFFWNFPSVLSYHQVNTLQLFSKLDLQSQATSPPTTTAQQHHQQPAQSKPPPQ